MTVEFEQGGEDLTLGLSVRVGDQGVRGSARDVSKSLKIDSGAVARIVDERSVDVPQDVHSHASMLPRRR